MSTVTGYRGLVVKVDSPLGDALVDCGCLVGCQGDDGELRRPYYLTLSGGGSGGRG